MELNQILDQSKLIDIIIAKYIESSNTIILNACDYTVSDDTVI